MEFLRGVMTMRLAKKASNRNKPNDYRNWSPAALDAAIMYQVQYGRDTQHLDHLLAARNYKETAA
jgi:hypothetical protein